MRDMAYEQANTIEGEIKCKNYTLCKSLLPTWWRNCNESYLCTNCDLMYGELTFKKIECPICFDYIHGVSQVKCDHFICVDCFKRCYYGDEDLENEPQFPYPELEEEYYQDMDHPKWKDYPFIRIFHDEWIRWDNRRVEQYEQEESLRHCPLCRK